MLDKSKYIEFHTVWDPININAACKNGISNTHKNAAYTLYTEKNIFPFPFPFDFEPNKIPFDTHDIFMQIFLLTYYI